MPTNQESLAAAFDSGRLDPLIALLDERVIWRGVIFEDDDRDDDQDQDVDDDHGLTLCTDRDQVRRIFEEFLASGATGYPVMIAEVGDTVVVDPRPQPPRPFPLHQSFTFRAGRVVLIQDYPDRVSALADVGL